MKQIDDGTGAARYKNSESMTYICCTPSSLRSQDTLTRRRRIQMHSVCSLHVSHEVMTLTTL